MSASDAMLASSPCSSVILGYLLCLSVAVAGFAPTAQSQSISTYHYDNSRTGWNPNETTLTPQNVPGLKLLTSISVDEQVDAQPLLVRGLTIAGGTHDVLYIATENDTVYALDATTGSVLLTRNFGPPVPQSVLPGQCNNNSGNVGINSTPVIDPASSTIYVMVYSYANGAPIFRLHALDLGTLSDKVPPAVVSASAKLTSNGGVYQFNPSVSRQRSGLLLAANGNIYAGFASFCDINANLSRGWLLGWQPGAGKLTPLSANQLDDQLNKSTDNFFLSSIWMSGYGVAADASNNLYFTTGNSDYSGTSYSTNNNLSESIIKMSPDLTKVEDFFTPNDPSFGVKYLDQNDLDTGSGGVLLLPPQPNSSASLAVAAGKVGQMYLLNRNNMGGYSNNRKNQVLGTFSIDNCWCGQSYFQGWDSAGRVVSSGGNNIIVWKVQTSPTLTLTQESVSPQLNSGQDGGFLTTVSSNGTQTPVIWAVGRPVDSSPANVTLYAFDPLAAAQGSSSWLFSAVAGTWPNTMGNANIVPVVANGRVYVASYQQLAIFGTGTAAPQTAQIAQQSSPQPAQPAVQDLTQLPPHGHELFGTISTVDGDMLTVATRTGALVNVDATEAVQAYQSVVLLVDEPVRMFGSYNAANVFQATVITRAKASPRLWPPDR
jgi:hypothetical protein